MNWIAATQDRNAKDKSATSYLTEEKSEVVELTDTEKASVLYAIDSRSQSVIENLANL